MTQDERNKLGALLWNIVDTLRGSMNADDFRDYMLAFLFPLHLSDNYEVAVKRKLDADYPVSAQHSRYVSTAVAEARIDLLTVNQQLVAIEQGIAAAKQQHFAYLKELGLPPLP